MRLTAEEIEAGKSPKGGFTRAQLAKWGVGWPPPQGWKEALLAGGQDTDPRLAPSPINPIVTAHDLLRNVVLAIIEQEHAHLLYEFPEVLAYFGARLNPEARNRVVSDNGFDHASRACAIGAAPVAQAVIPQSRDEE
jgi:hypothetical protein